MKDFNEYKTKLPYPNKVDFITVYAYHKGEVVAEMSLTAWNDAKDRYDGVTVEKDLDNDAFIEARNAYRADEQRLVKEFAQDLYEEFDVLRFAKRDKAFALAWEYGHSSGFSEVYNYFADLAELLS